MQSKDSIKISISKNESGDILLKRERIYLSLFERLDTLEYTEYLNEILLKTDSNEKQFNELKNLVK